MKRAIVAISGVVGVLSSSMAVAVDQSDFNRTIDRVGVNNVFGGVNQNKAYFFTAETPTIITCVYFVIDITTTVGRAQYAELLAAKIAGKKLSRMDYNQGGGVGPTCYLTLLEIGNL